MWARVFSIWEAVPTREEFTEHLERGGAFSDALFQDDELGWFHADLKAEDGVYSVDVYQTDDAIRRDLNTWAAWLEINGGESWMQPMISTRNLITLRHQDLIDAPLARETLHALARFFAQRTGGIYQIDGEGFFDSTGELLVKET